MSAKYTKSIGFRHKQGHSQCTWLSNVECVQHKNVLIVLRQRNDVSLGRNLQAAAAAHLHVRTLKLTNQRRVTLEHGNVKPVSMAVTDKNVTCVADIDSVRVVGEVLAANTAQELSFLAEHDDTVALQQQQRPHSTMPTFTQLVDCQI